MNHRPKRLSDTFLKNISRPGRYSDGGRGIGNGLTVHVKPRADDGMGKFFVQRIRVGDKVLNLGLGSFPAVTLAEARRRALANRQLVEEGGDPRGDKRTPTVREALEAVIDLHRPTWRSADSERQWRGSMERFAAPIMDKRVSEVTSGEVLGIVAPIWSEKQETARRVKGRLTAIFKWCVAQGHIATSPAGPDTFAALPKQAKKTKHHQALAPEAVPEAIATVQASNSSPAVKLLHRFLVLTCTRTGEARHAEWGEIDLEDRLWTIPGSKTKSGEPHRVPLSDQAVETLADARTLGSGKWVFPAPSGKPLSKMALLMLMRRLGIEASPHGYRTSARVWMARTGVDRDTAEKCLAHAERNKVVAAYDRDDRLSQRTGVMRRWADFVSSR